MWTCVWLCDSAIRDSKVWTWAGLEPWGGEQCVGSVCGKQACQLQQPTRARTGDSFGAPLYLELAEDALIMPFHCV